MKRREKVRRRYSNFIGNSKSFREMATGKKIRMYFKIFKNTVTANSLNDISDQCNTQTNQMDNFSWTIRALNLILMYVVCAILFSFFSHFLERMPMMEDINKIFFVNLCSQRSNHSDLYQTPKKGYQPKIKPAI